MEHNNRRIDTGRHAGSMGSRAQRNENTTPSVLIAEPVQAKQPAASRDASTSNADTHHTSSHGVDGGPVYFLPQLLCLEFGRGTIEGLTLYEKK